MGWNSDSGGKYNIGNLADLILTYVSTSCNDDFEINFLWSTSKATIGEHLTQK